MLDYEAKAVKILAYLLAILLAYIMYQIIEAAVKSPRIFTLNLELEKNTVNHSLSIINSYVSDKNST